MTPANGVRIRNGRNWSPVVMPSELPEWVSCSTSQSCATRCIQVPVLLTSVPIA